MKSYTDLEQSKKLAEILPLESADTIWDLTNLDLPTIRAIPYEDSDYSNKYLNIIPCWGLAALLDVLPNESDIVKGKLDVADYKYMCTVCIKEEVITVFGNNLLDACYELIIKLYKRNLL
jgi:hypothetical protein